MTLPRKALHQILLRDIGLALAVLALWMLMLLAPLHRTGGLLAAFDAAGVSVQLSGSICANLAQEGSDHKPQTLLCPAAALVKAALPQGFATSALGLIAPEAAPAFMPLVVVSAPEARRSQPLRARGPPNFL